MAYIYEAEIANAGVDRDLMPSYAPLCEGYYYLQEATERDWANFTYELGIGELGFLEATGTEEVQSETKKNGLINLIQKALEHIKGLVQGALDKIGEAIRKTKNNLNAKFKDALVKKLQMSDGKTEDGMQKQKVYYQFNEYLGIDKIQIDANNLADKSVEDVKNSISKTPIDVTYNWLVKNKGVDKLLQYATDFKFLKNQIGGNYTAIKKDLNEELKKVKGNNDSSKNDIDAVKTKIRATNKYAAIILQCYHERQRSAIKILTSLAVKFAVGKADPLSQSADEARAKKAARDAKKGKVTGESALLESYNSEVERLFDWNF